MAPGRRRVAFGLVTLSLGACALGAEADREIAEEVGRFLSAHSSAFAELDTARIRSLYVADSRFNWVEDGAVRYSSVGDILSGLEGLPTGVRLETTYDDRQVTVLSADLAGVRSGFETSFVDAAGGGFSFSGVITMIVERGEDGWRIVSGHTSTARRDAQGR